jgi:hypothetical protein
MQQFETWYCVVYVIQDMTTPGQGRAMTRGRGRARGRGISEQEVSGFFRLESIHMAYCLFFVAFVCWNETIIFGF